MLEKLNSERINLEKKNVPQLPPSPRARRVQEFPDPDPTGSILTLILKGFDQFYEISHLCFFIKSYDNSVPIFNCSLRYRYKYLI